MKKRPIYKQWWFWVAIGGLIYVINSTYEPPETDNTPPPTENYQSFDTTTSLDGDVLVDSRTLTSEESTQIALNIVNNQFQHTGIAGYNADLSAIVITLTEGGMEYIVEDMRVGYTSRDKWHSMVEEMRRISISVANTANYDTSLILISPTDRQNALIIVRNGYVHYDAVYD